MHVTEPTYVLRDATGNDAAAIADIYNESVRVGDATMDEVPYTTESVRGMIEGFNKRETILILEGGEETFGWGIIKRYSDRHGYRFCCETSVYLRRRYVGQGYGTYLKRAVIERCRDYGYHHLVARIFADNSRSIEYNRKLGYELVGIQKQVGYRNDRWQDIAILQLVLDDVPPRIPAKHT